MRVETDVDVMAAARPGMLRSLWVNPVGRKALMAVSGVVLFLYVLAHMLGNLQIFGGEAPLDRYAQLLHASPPFLWTARVILLAALAVHVVAGVQLWVEKRRARPVGYATYAPVVATPASRTMFWSGILILGFVVYHVLDLTAGVVNPDFEEGQVYRNVLASLSRAGASLFYLVALVGLGFHLFHGLRSMFQSLGFMSAGWLRPERRFATLFAVLVAIGFGAIPVAVLLGLGR